MAKKPSQDHGTGDTNGRGRGSGGSPEPASQAAPSVDLKALDSLGVAELAELERRANERAHQQQDAADRALEDRVEAERGAVQYAEAERLAAQRAEDEVKAAEQAAQRRSEAQRKAAEHAQAQQAHSEREQAAQSAAAEAAARREQAEQALRAHTEAEQAARIRATQEHGAAEKAAGERLASEQLVEELGAAERAARERASAIRSEADDAALRRTEAEELVEDLVQRERSARAEAAAQRALGAQIAARRAIVARGEAERARAALEAAERAARESAEIAEAAAARAREAQAGAQVADEELAATEQMLASLLSERQHPALDDGPPARVSGAAELAAHEPERLPAPPSTSSPGDSVATSAQRPHRGDASESARGVAARGPFIASLLVLLGSAGAAAFLMMGDGAPGEPEARADLDRLEAELPIAQPTVLGGTLPPAVVDSAAIQTRPSSVAPAAGTPLPAAPAPAALAPSPVPAPVPAPTPSAESAPKSDQPAWERYAVAAPPSNGRPIVAIVIDDMGVDVANSERAMQMRGPLTTAFLPYAQNVVAQAQRAHMLGHELLVHVPMEPLSTREDPGPNALDVSQDVDELRSRLAWNLSRFPGIVGINNHMGSRFTRDTARMRIVLGELKKRQLLFLDSVTTETSVGTEVARQVAIPFARRDVFLDHTQTIEQVAGQLEELERIARRRGFAIAIGHPHGTTLQVLEPWLKTLESRGLVLAPLSAIVRRQLGATSGSATSASRQG
jgi:uncharacterized protein